MSFSRFSLLLLLIFLPNLSADPDTPFPERVWTNQEGVKITAKLVSCDADTVTIRIKEGREYTLERVTLSLLDNQYLDTEKAAITEKWPNRDDFQRDPFRGRRNAESISATLVSQGFRFGFPVEFNTITGKIKEIRPSTDFTTVTLVLDAGIICLDFPANRITTGRYDFSDTNRLRGHQYKEKVLYRIFDQDRGVPPKRLFGIGDTITFYSEAGISVDWVKGGVLQGIGMATPNLQIFYE